MSDLFRFGIVHDNKLTILLLLLLVDEVQHCDITHKSTRCCDEIIFHSYSSIHQSQRNGIKSSRSIATVGLENGNLQVYLTARILA